MNRGLSFVSSLLAFVVGCGLFPSSGGDDPEADGGPGSPPGNMGMDGRWTLEDPTDRVYGPGELIQLRVDGIRPSEGPAMLWVGRDGELMMGFVSARREEPADPEGDPDAPAAWVLTTPLPVMQAGTYQIGVGTADELVTHSFPIEVVVPEPRLSQVQTATALASGLRALVADVRSAISEGDPEWEAVTGDSLEPETLAAMLSALDELDAVADGVAEDYMAIDPADEPAFQAVLDNSGLLGALEASATPPPSGIRTLALPARITGLIHRPIHAALYTFDLIDMALVIAGLTIDAVEIISGLTGALPIAAASVGAKLVIGCLKAIIENFVPTDLVAIEGHGPRLMFEGEGVHFVAWGRFEPANGGGAILRSMEDIVLTAVSELLPGGGPAITKSQRAKRFLQQAFEYVYMRLPGSFIESAVGHDELKFTGILTPVALGVYEIKLSEALDLIPVGGGILAGASRLIWDPDVFPPYAVAAASPSWALTAEPWPDYSMDLVAIRNVGYPAGGPDEALISLQASGYAFTTEPSWGGYASIPWVDAVRSGAPAVTVKRAPNPMDPNEVIADEAFIIEHVVAPDGSEQRWVSARTPATRRHAIQFRDVFTAFPGEQTRTTVLVNGEAQHTDVDINAMPELVVDLSPGRNEVTIVAGDAGGLACSMGTTYCVEITIPDAANADYDKGIYLDPGESLTFELYTPPAW